LGRLRTWARPLLTHLYGLDMETSALLQLRPERHTSDTPTRLHTRHWFSTADMKLAVALPGSSDKQNLPGKV
jgi:hypothetical protein